MKIDGPNFFNYDPQHLQIVQREIARSIKPQVFKDMDDSVAMALLFSDAVELSPEAKMLLKKLKAQLEGGSDLSQLAQQESLQELTYTLKQLRDLVYGKQDVKGEEVTLPFIIQLSGQEKDEESRKKSGSYSRLQEILEKMVVYAPGESVKKILLQELEPLGGKVIQQVKGFGVKIIVLSRNMSLTDLRIAGMSMVAKGEKSFDGRPWEMVRGIYDQSRRLIVIGEERVGVPGNSAARHEFAHAYDHTFSVQNQRRLPLSVQLWNFFAEKRKELVSDYAGVNPAEYFAEAVEKFFAPQGKEKLEKKDPQMFQYLNALFAG